MTNEDAQEGHDESQEVKWVSYVEMSEGLRGDIRKRPRKVSP